MVLGVGSLQIAVEGAGAGIESEFSVYLFCCNKNLLFGSWLRTNGVLGVMKLKLLFRLILGPGAIDFRLETGEKLLMQDSASKGRQDRLSRVDFLILATTLIIFLYNNSLN